LLALHGNEILYALSLALAECCDIHNKVRMTFWQRKDKNIATRKNHFCIPTIHCKARSPRDVVAEKVVFVPTRLVRSPSGGGDRALAVASTTVALTTRCPGHAAPIGGREGLNVRSDSALPRHQKSMGKIRDTMKLN
jgi:hypothetical protein